MHSVSDLTTFARKTTGDVPPTLVGASTTVVGNKVYLFGGRLVAERQMVSDLYMFDMDTFVWTRIRPQPGDDVPGGRYFHSTEAWNNHLVVFGGMGQNPASPSADDLCVLSDVRLYDIPSNRWLPADGPASASPDSVQPVARYAHLSSITSNCLYIIGGQDLNNLWLDEVLVYSLPLRQWVARRDFPLHCGAYRSVAVASSQVVRYPMEEREMAGGTARAVAALGPPGTRFRTDKVPPAEPECSPSESLMYAPYSAPPTDEFPSDVFLYSNWNFTDVKRELEILSPQPTPLHPPGSFSITDKSSQMTGTGLPPGLRFPTGAVLGSYLIIAGTYLAHTYQSFSIWALDLTTLVWTRIDPGSTLQTGSWARAVLQPTRNRFLIFGNRNGNLVEDYTRRLLSWDDVACIDLEAFGIYQPPRLLLEPVAQEAGLAALEEGVLTDFEMICDDGRKLPCSRAMLEERWPWFRAQRAAFVRAAEAAAKKLPNIAAHVPMPDMMTTPSTPTPTSTSLNPGTLEPSSSSGAVIYDPRLSPRALKLSEPYPITLALLQYFYSLALITPLQNAPAVLSQLLLLASTYKLGHLESLVKHAMHRALTSSTSVGIYEVATLCGAQSLQIRALKAVMQSSGQRSKTRSRSERGGGSGREGGSGGGGSRSDYSSTSGRPRGTSDAAFMKPGEGQSGISTYRAGYTANDIDLGNNVPVDGEESSSDTPPSSSLLRPPPNLNSIFVNRTDYSREQSSIAVPDTPRPFMGVGENRNGSYFDLLQETILEADEYEESESDHGTQQDHDTGSTRHHGGDGSSTSSHRRYASLAPSVSLNSLRRVAMEGGGKVNSRRRPVSVGSSSLYSQQSEDGECEAHVYRPSHAASPVKSNYMPFHLPRRKQHPPPALCMSQSSTSSTSGTGNESDTPSLTSSLSAQSGYLSGQSSPRVGVHTTPSVVLPAEHLPPHSGTIILPSLGKIDELPADGEESVLKSSIGTLLPSSAPATPAPTDSLRAASPFTPLSSGGAGGTPASGYFITRRPRTSSSEISTFSTSTSSSERTEMASPIASVLSPTSPFKRFFGASGHSSSTTSLSLEAQKAEKLAAKVRAKAQKLEAQAAEMDRAAYEAALREKLNVSRVHEEKAKRAVEAQRAIVDAEAKKKEKKRAEAMRKRERENFSYLGGML